MSKPLFYGWVLLGALWFVFAFNLGFPAYGGPVLNSAMAKELGFSGEGCVYCHQEKLPKKGAATFNDRGKWLMAEKDKRKAKEVDPAWLKDYVEAKK